MHTNPPCPTDSEAQMPEANAMLPSQARSALREAAAALDQAERYLQPLEMSLALAQMARCYRALQALRPAALYLERALAWARTLGAADQAVEILCLLAETSCSVAELHAQDDSRRSHAALERTRDWAFEATRMASHVADPQWEIKVLLRISDVLDRCGDHDDAVELQSRAMRLMYGPHAGPDAATSAQAGQQAPADG
jgi:tetratricopeptide (TPR) repeat protein